jgi:hypothetical protein
MADIDNGGPAFPFVRSWQQSPLGYRALEHIDGLTIRDYFAAKALSGFLAAYAGEGVVLPPPRTTAVDCYEYADALIEVRKRKETT